MQLILSGIERRDNCLKRFAEHSKGILTPQWDGESIPVVVGNLHGADKIQMQCRERGIPYILIDHGYFNRCTQLTWARFCVNNYHCTDWRTSDRKIPKAQEWKRGNHIVLLPPANHIAEIYSAKDWVDNTVAELKKYTDRKIITKIKGRGDLGAVLKGAHAVVSFGSVGEIEAALQGIPVYSSPYSPTVPISQPLSEIEQPKYPDREGWMRSLAACEWRKDEMAQCWQRIREQLEGI